MAEDEGFDERGNIKDEKRRKTRNQNEKKRRDQFNILVKELMSLVGKGSKRKMDKSLVLRTTINLLKNQKDVQSSSDTIDQWKPSFLNKEEFNQIMFEALNGFILTLSRDGTIIFASDNVCSILGHTAVSMTNEKIFSYIHPSEHTDFYSCLQSRISADSLFHGYETSGVQRFGDVQGQLPDSSNLKGLYCHMCTRQHKSDGSVTYEKCKVSGCFKTLDGMSDETDSNECFIATVRVLRPNFHKNISIVNQNNEFVSRLSLEWKFLFLDHRASAIIGYLAFEVLGTSGYDYNHHDDMEDLIKCHERLIQFGEATSGYYRFLTKGQQWIWLKTRYYITYNQWNSKPEFIVCTNTAVSYNEVIEASEKELESAARKAATVARRDTPPSNKSEAYNNTVPAHQDSRCSERNVMEFGSENTEMMNKSAGNVAESFAHTACSYDSLCAGSSEQSVDLRKDHTEENRLIEKQKELLQIISNQQFELQNVCKELANYQSSSQPADSTFHQQFMDEYTFNE